MNILHPMKIWAGMDTFIQVIKLMEKEVTHTSTQASEFIKMLKKENFFDYMLGELCRQQNKSWGS